MKRVAFETLGCKLNFAESSTLARRFEAEGYTVVSPDQPSDVYVINTCSVTEHADKKCRNIIRRMHRLSPEAAVAVTGCYAQLKPQEVLDIEGVDLVVGADRKGELFELLSGLLSTDRHKRAYCCDTEHISSIFPAFSSGERTRSFLKVQDGCDYRCSYCTVPLARGHSRNIPIAELVGQARRIASCGIKEIVLTGVNTGDYGRTSGETFADLLKALNEVDGIGRYRISSIEPNLLTPQTVEWIAGGTKFLPHFHIPLQSGSDAVLARMRRRYNTSAFASKIDMIRDFMETPSDRFTKVFFGIDVIVGFPGETDAEFEQCRAFLEGLRPAFLHVFPYSRRPGTPAFSMPLQVPEDAKAERARILAELSDRLHREFCQANAGRRDEVLFESKAKGGRMFGYTRNYIRVERPYDESQIGRIVSVTV